MCRLRRGLARRPESRLGALEARLAISLRRDPMPDTGRSDEQAANAILQHPVGARHPFALVQEFEPRLDQEQFDEFSLRSEILENPPGISAVAFALASNFLHRGQEGNLVLGLDVIYDRHQDG